MSSASYIVTGTRGRKHLVPDVASDTFALLGAAQTFTGVQTFSSAASLTFHSGAVLQGNPGTVGEWEKGIKITETLTAGTYSGGEWKGKYGRALEVQVDTTNQYDGHSFGAVYISMNRTTTQTPGGSPDCGLRLESVGYNSTTGGNRGLDAQAYSRALTSNCHGALITARVKNSGILAAGAIVYGARIVSKCQSSSAAGASSRVHGLEVADESDGVVPSENSIVFVEKQSNSYTAATKAGIEIINNSNTSYAQVITNGIYFKCGATNSNITNAFGFDSTDGTDGATYKNGTYTGSGDTIIIRVLVGSTPYYLIGYATAT